MNVNSETTKYEGVYEVPEAAGYLRASMRLTTPLNVTSTKLIYWIRRGLTLPGLTVVPGREVLIAFEDLISMRVIAALRAAGVSFKKIYQAERWLRQTTGHPRPFATELLWTERSDIFVEFRRKLIAASRSGQYAMEILRDYLIPVHGLTFDEHGLAKSWEPYEDILLNPLIQFGAPCIKDTRIPTRVVWGMVKGGDSVEMVATSYKIREDEVKRAISWEEAFVAP
jgi:uncharacterized protein (DUF433 family)/DNA-binding transcriptional MerR regulator